MRSGIAATTHLLDGPEISRPPLYLLQPRITRRTDLQLAPYSRHLRGVLLLMLLQDIAVHGRPGPLRGVISGGGSDGGRGVDALEQLRSGGGGGRGL